MTGYFCLIFFGSCFWLDLFTTQNTVSATIFVKPSASFKAKLRLFKNSSNVVSVVKPLRLELGPRYSKKKSEDRERDDLDLDLDLDLDFDWEDKWNSHSDFHTIGNDSVPSKFQSQLIKTHEHGLRFKIHRKWTLPDYLRDNQVEFDTHEVTTEDGYILTLFRLHPCRQSMNDAESEPNLNGDFDREELKVQIFLHGILGSAVDWLIGDPDSIYPYYALKRGFEAWLVNFRGNEYGSKHRTLSTLSPAFWRFSFHEQGVYDMPAIVDYVLKHTNMRPRSNGKFLNFVAYSTGTTSFYIFMDFHGKKYKPFIDSMIGISPSAYNSRSQSSFKNLIPYVDYFRAFPIDGPLLKSTIVDFAHFSLPELCILKLRGRSLCEVVNLLISGDGAGDPNPAILRRLFEHFPSTTSKRFIVHFLQLYQSDVFRQFDHGMKLNLLYYNQSTPPPYNLYKVNVPTISFYGQNDIAIDTRDVEQTLDSFGASFPGHGSYQVADFTRPAFLYDDVLPAAYHALVDEYFREIGRKRNDSQRF